MAFYKGFQCTCILKLKKIFACTVTKLKLRFLTFKLNKSSFSMIKKVVYTNNKYALVLCVGEDAFLRY